MLSFFLPYIHTEFSHTSVQLDLGKTIRKVTESFLILWKGSDFRTKVFLHLFLLQNLNPKNPPWISSHFLFFFFSHFFVSFFYLCSQRKAGFWNPKCQVPSPLLHISGLTGLQLPRWLRSEIHPYKNPVSDNSWYLKERKGEKKKKSRKEKKDKSLQNKNCPSDLFYDSMSWSLSLYPLKNCF